MRVGSLFRNEAVEERFQVRAHFRLHPLVERQGGGGVLQEQVADAHAKPLQLRQLRSNLTV